MSLRPLSDWKRRNRLKKKQIIAVIFIFLLLFTAVMAPAQEILTAEKYFDEISDRYGKVQDYEANITITKGDTVMKGVIYYKSPNLLRIDFTEPKDQVLVTNGEELTIYIPKYEVIMKQKLRKRSNAAVASMASKQGLTFLKRNYGIGYLIGPSPVPLDEKSKEKVIKLKLTSRSNIEGFRQIILSIGENGLIRRIKAVTINYDELVFDFTDIKINQNIPDTRFDYDAPAYANVFNNFLFESEQ